MSGITKAKYKWLLNNLFMLLTALFLAIAVKAFLFQAFNIPSGSMRPTLLVGDCLFASKYSYGYSKYSIPFGLISFPGKILAKTPELGDIVIFRLPTNPNLDYIKRVVGGPGDLIQIKLGRLFVNGRPVDRELLPESEMNRLLGHSTQNELTNNTQLFRETLPNGVSYLTLQSKYQPPPSGIPRIFVEDTNNTIVYRVPEKHYFVLGDNRNDSRDSRFMYQVGFIPAENIIGKAQILFYSADTSQQGTWFESVMLMLKQPWRIRFSRFFHKL